MWVDCMKKDSLGIPGKGFHTHFMGVAWRDVLGTIVIGMLLGLVFKWNLYYSILGFFLVGIALHRYYGVRTTLDKFLFPKI
jgi:hypothetical protein